MNKIDNFKSLLHKLIKEELESGDGEEKQAGPEKVMYDLVLEPADLQSTLSALNDKKNYGRYSNNLRDEKAILRVFGPSNPAQKANTAWRTWDGLNDEERFAKAADIRNRVPEAWKALESDLANKYDEWQTENGDGSFIEFISTLSSSELRNVKSNGFFGSRGANYYLDKLPINLLPYSGIMTKDKDYIVSGDKIIFPQKTNPFETKDYLTKVLKTIMSNAKLQYSISQKESDDQPATTSNTQGKVEKINFIKTFDTPELAKKFMKLIPKDFAEKTTVDGGKITVSDITDSQKKNLIASALQFIASQPKKPMKEEKEELYMISKGGRKDNPHYVLEKTDGSNQISITFSSPEEAKKYANKKGLKLSSQKGYNMKESIKDQIKQAVMEVLQEKKLSKAEKNKKEDIVKAMAKQGALKDSKTYAIATAKAKKLAEGEGDTSMDNILLAFQAALDIEDDVRQEQALKAVYNALKDKVKGKLGQAYNYAKEKVQAYDDSLEENV